MQIPEGSNLVNALKYCFEQNLQLLQLIDPNQELNPNNSIQSPGH